MLLKGQENTEFELTISGYQNPDQTSEPFDADWLKIDIRVVHPKGTWRIIDPCLLTWEVQAIAEWFDKLASGTMSNLEQDFVEPNLSMKLIGNKLRVYFELECRPPWARSSYANLNDLWIDLDTAPTDLRHAADSLRLQLNRFPVRVKVE